VIKKKITHKIKWQYVCEEQQGWKINIHVTYGTKSICNNNCVSKSNKSGSVYWKDVTCKNCLKMRK
jgi:hypothetical protein